MAQELTWKVTVDPALAAQAMRSIAQEAKTTAAQVTAAVKAHNREVAAAWAQRAAQERAVARSSEAMWRQHETQKLASTKAAEKQGEAVVAASNQVKERLAQRMVAVRRQQEAELAANIKRYERERLQIATQNERAVARLARSEADTRIREGRRAANALLAMLREQAQQARQLSRQATVGIDAGGAFLAGAAGGLTALVGAAAVSQIRQAGAAWLDYASKLENAKIAFTTMLGSAELAQQHLNELQQFALKTPFQFADLIDASQRMQALGFNAAQVVPILTDVGNAVAAAGGGAERLDRVVLALSQMQSKGRVATQEMNQLAEAGIPGWKILEQQLGKSRAELVKMVEQGQISSAVFLEAFQKFSQQNFGGLMEAQSKTFTGAMSNIKDALLQTSATAFEPLYDKLSKMAQEMSTASTKSKEFQENMKQVGSFVSTVFDGAVVAFHVVKDTLGLLSAAGIQFFGLWVHGFLALYSEVMRYYNAVKMIGQFMLGDFAGAMNTATRMEQQHALAISEATEALRSQGAVAEQVVRIIEDAEARKTRAVLATAAAIASAELGSAYSGPQRTGGSLTLSPGLRSGSGAGVPAGGGKGKKTRSTELQDAIKDAELAERELTQRIAADVAENRRSYEEQERDIVEFTRRAIELAEERHDAAIVRINDEQLAFDTALAKKQISQQAYNQKNRELRLDNDRAQREFDDAKWDAEQKRDKQIAAAQVASRERSLQIASEAADRQIALIRDRIKQGIELESEGEKKIAAIIQEIYRQRREALELEMTMVSTSAEQRAAINDELIRLEGERAGAVVEASRKVRDALEEERKAYRKLLEESWGKTRPRTIAGATRPRRAEARDEERPEGAIDQLFIDINDKLTGNTQTAALAGLQALTEAFSGLGQAVGQVVEAWVLYGNAGTSVRKVTAQILAGVAQQAAVKAVFELAEGFAALALAFFGLPNAGPSAAAHFTAAAIYGSIAGIAAIAGRAVAGDAFKQASGTAGAGTSTTTRQEPRDRTIRESRQGGASDPNAVIGRLAIDLKYPDGHMETQMVRIVNRNGEFRATVRRDLLGEANG